MVQQDASAAFARVVSVSASTPRLERMGEMDVLTSISKSPGAGPVMVWLDGLAGNRTAVHPEAVYGIGVEAYDYWADRLEVDRSAWEWGRWGENITFQGLFEKDLRIGDLVEVGDQLVLEVCGGRVPCSKLAWRLGQPVSVLATLVESGVMGFYFRVVQPGPVSAGDPVRVERRHPTNMTVLDLPRFIQDPSAPSAAVREALAMPGLSDYAKMFLRQRLSRAIEAEETSSTSWRGWRDFTVDEVVVESADVKSFWLRPADEAPLGAFRPGQFLTVRVPDGHGGQTSRQWSLSDLGSDGRYRISVKRLAQGAGSTWLHEEVTRGTVVAIRSPAGRFVPDSGSVKPVVLVSAGIGVTPLIPMLKSRLARDEASPPPVFWFHGSRNGRQHAFKDEIAQLTTDRHDLTARTWYSRPSDDDRVGRDFDHEGRLTFEGIRPMVERVSIVLSGELVEVPGQMCEYFICGPDDFQHEMRSALAEWGVDASDLFCESFTPPAGRAVDSVPESEVTFALSGRTATWREDEELTLLELAEQQGIDAPSSCRIGTCHSCIGRVAEGGFEHTVEIEGVGAGHALLCSAVPTTDRLVIDL